jgi:hypothetical protein
MPRFQDSATTPAAPEEVWKIPYDPARFFSCLFSDLQFEWRLDPNGTGTRISVDVDIPEQEAHRLEGRREVIAASLAHLAALAASE